MTLRGPGCLSCHLAAAPLLLLALALSITLPLAPHAAAYEAVITEASVEVRSGAGRAYYPVGTLERGDRVQVETELFGWYQIRCPEGVFSYVEQKNVNAKGDGSRGEVNTDRTSVYAAHADTNKSPAESYRKLLDLERGDVVTIVGTVDNYYRIIPPQTAFVFLPPKALTAAEAVAGADLPADPPAESTLPEPAVDPASASAQAPREDVRLAPVITPAPPAATEAATATQLAEPTTEAPPIDPAPAAPRVEPTVPVPAVAEAPTLPGPALTPIKPEPAPAPRRVATMYPPPGEPVVRPDVVTIAQAHPPAGSGDLLTDPEVQVAKPDVPISSPAVHPAVVAMEASLLPYFTLPVDEQPLARMTAGYAEIAELDSLTDGDRRLIESRLRELERNREMAVALRADAPATELEPTPEPVPAPIPPVAIAPTPAPTPAPAPAPVVEPAPTPTPAPAPAPAPAPVDPVGPVGPGYDAVGVLTVSTVHTGENQPELLRLLDPSGQRTIAYLEPNADLDAVQMMGQLVGIKGTSSYDPSLKLRLIKPDQIVVLGAVNR